MSRGFSSLILIGLSVVLGVACAYDFEEEFNKSTADRVREHGYPAEEHQVETSDNYVITLFRIPHGHASSPQAGERRPVVFLQHGLLSCSDAWILNGPNDALAFLLADAGYDVWMGNARGNRYSRHNTRLSTRHPYFWRFSWHEIAVVDIAEVIDYVLGVSGETSLHYVGHSQGTTVFSVLMSMRTEYNAKIKTAHLLAPVAFMSHMSTLLAKYTRRFIGRPNALTRVIDTQEILPSSKFWTDVEELFCRQHAVTEFMCNNIIFLLDGDDGVNMNTTISARVNETHPAGASSTQVMHYMQEYESGRFCQFDHGTSKNLQTYGQPTPPDYDVSQITAAVHLYYSDADELADVVDVEHLAALLPNVQGQFHVPDPTFTHGDFIWSWQVKEVINDRVIGACDAYEEALLRTP